MLAGAVLSVALVLLLSLPAQGQPPPEAGEDGLYFRDGSRTIKLRVAEGLVLDRKNQRVVGAPQRALEGTAAPANEGGSVAAARTALESPQIPVFMTEAGELLAPVGGVVLILRESWTSRQVDLFLEREGLLELATPLGAIPNGYTVPTVPGMAALELANEMASREGVRVAAPNWWRDLRER